MVVKIRAMALEQERIDRGRDFQSTLRSGSQPVLIT